MSFMKNVWDRAVGAVKDFFTPQHMDDTLAPPADVSRYAHVSVPLIPQEGIERVVFGDYKRAPGPGRTWFKGNNFLKAQADRLAKDCNMSNKKRRRLRTQMKRRQVELLGQMVNA